LDGDAVLLCGLSTCSNPEVSQGRTAAWPHDEVAVQAATRESSGAGGNDGFGAYDFVEDGGRGKDLCPAYLYTPVWV
jgi:hypothetical protein